MTLQAEGRKLVNVGNYRLTGKRLGKGNFARVEEAVHSVLNTKVALKIIDVTAIKEDYVIKNLYREAKIMSRLFHPCIAALFQTMQFGNLYYLVMELVGGGDLCSFIKAQRNGKLDERCTRVYARQLVSAISHMHNVGIVHRDLKMENLMLNSIHTQIKIVDFGLSNTYTDSNPLRTHCGSPEYAAPELFMEGKHYGPEVDLWSLGVILYGMVVGQLPFVTIRENNMTSQERRKKLLEQINKGIAAPHRRAMTLFSNEFKGMIGRLLVPDAPKRITIKELIFHPWITEKGRKAVRSNPLKKLDGQHQAIITRDMSSLLRLALAEVDCAIRSEPQGNIAGIYNILSFKQTLRQIEGDGVTRIIPDQSLNYIMPRSREHTIKIERTGEKRKEGLKSAPLKKGSAKATSRTAPKIATPRNSVNTTAREEKSVKKKVVPKILLSKYEKNSLGKVKQTDFVPLKKTSLSADEYKRAMKLTEQLTQKPMAVNRYTGTHPIENVLNFSKPIIPNTPKSYASRSPSSLASSALKDKKIVTNQGEGSFFFLQKGIRSADMKTINIKLSEKSTPKSLSARIQSANLRNIRPEKFVQTPPSRRPLTGPIHTAERALKRRSMLPVTTSTNTPSRGVTTTTFPQSAPMHSRKIVQVQKVPDARDLLKSGDQTKKLPYPSPTSKIPTTKHFVNEPIARSIAGYVVNNIPNKFQTFKWIKATKKDST